MDNPFLVNPNHSTYFAMFEWACNWCILYNDSTSSSTSGSHATCLSSHSHPPESGYSTPPSTHHFYPLDKEWKGSGNSFHKIALCLHCGASGHCASECSTSHASHPKCTILCDWHNNNLTNKSNKQICIMFNVCGLCSNTPSSTYGDHSCSLCGDQHYVATSCPRN